MMVSTILSKTCIPSVYGFENILQRIYLFILDFSCCCCSPRLSAMMLTPSILVTGVERGHPGPAAMSQAALSPRRVSSIGLVVWVLFEFVCIEIDVLCNVVYLK